MVGVPDAPAVPATATGVVAEDTGARDVEPDPSEVATSLGTRPAADTDPVPAQGYEAKVADPVTAQFGTQR